MSAREQVLALLWWVVPSATDEEARAKAAELLDAYAHELAEQQRAWFRREGYGLDCVCKFCTVCLARDYIDLIDPEVNQ